MSVATRSQALLAGGVSVIEGNSEILVDVVSGVNSEFGNQRGVPISDDHRTPRTSGSHEARIRLKEKELEIEALKLQIELEKLKLQCQVIEGRKRANSTNLGRCAEELKAVRSPMPESDELGHVRWNCPTTNPKELASSQRYKVLTARAMCEQTPRDEQRESDAGRASNLLGIDIVCGSRHFRASVDSGAAITVLRKSIVAKAVGIETSGTVHLQGAFGHSVSAEMGCVPLALAANDVGSNPCLSVLCAMTDELAEDMEALLTPDVYDALKQASNHAADRAANGAPAWVPPPLDLDLPEPLQAAPELPPQFDLDMPLPSVPESRRKSQDKPAVDEPVVPKPRRGVFKFPFFKSGGSPPVSQQAETTWAKIWAFFAQLVFSPRRGTLTRVKVSVDSGGAGPSPKTPYDSGRYPARLRSRRSRTPVAVAWTQVDVQQAATTENGLSNIEDEGLFHLMKLRRKATQCKMASKGGVPAAPLMSKPAAGNPSGLVSNGSARAAQPRSKTATWRPRDTPKMSADDIIVVLKPRETLHLKTVLQTGDLGAAIAQCVGGEAGTTLNVWRVWTHNLIVCGTQHVEAANKLARDFNLNVGCNSVLLRGRVKLNREVCRGVITMLADETTTSLKGKVVWREGDLAFVRKLGTSNVAVLTFVGRREPRYVHYNCECAVVREYKRTVPACYHCGTIGHRIDN
ncbi:hypothetical protein HPB49_006363 [Dermacentor silvarum]|uniref:Uncharacterized protein n=1 Tax=Dermacentor silvarum TaxID=543639 RepID=A0ACB8D3A6_DERSI|nr:hypothetical protein HPB49_006363 [Dermacentor silvarum]